MVYVYLLGLTVSNLCIMITAIPAFIDVANGVGGCNYATFWWKVNKLSLKSFKALWQAHLKWPLCNSFIVCSVFIIICMTVSKFMAIFKPLTFQRINTLKNARICIGLSFICSALLHIPDSFRFKVVFNDSNPSNTSTGLSFSTNETVVDCGWDWKDNDEFYSKFKAYLGASQFLKRVGPIVILAILNTLITYKYLTISQELEVPRPRASLKPSSQALPPTSER